MACERKVEVTTPVRYEKSNLHFDYPANWTVTDDIDGGDIRYLFIENPGDAIVIVFVYLAEDAEPLNKFSKMFSSQAKKQVPMGSFGNSVYSDIEKPTRSGKLKGIKETFTMSLLSIEIPHEREYFRISMGKHEVYLINQVATEDLSKVRSGFNLILDTITVE